MKLLSMKEAATKAGIAKATAYRLAEAGLFPKPVAILMSASGRVVRSAVTEPDVDAWIRDRLANGPVTVPSGSEAA